jgi:hypothetical protein
MQSRFGLSAIIAASLLASTTFAFAQGAGTDGVTGAPVTQMPSPSASPPPATSTTGMGGGASQPGRAEHDDAGTYRHRRVAERFSWG